MWFPIFCWRVFRIHVLQVVRIWDARTGELLERLRGHRDSVYSVAFTPDGRGLVSGSLDKTLKFWDVGALVSAAGNDAGGNAGTATGGTSGGAIGGVKGRKEGSNEPGSGGGKKLRDKSITPSPCTMDFVGHKV